MDERVSVRNPELVSLIKGFNTAAAHLSHDASSSGNSPARLTLAQTVLAVRNPAQMNIASVCSGSHGK